MKIWIIREYEGVTDNYHSAAGIPSGSVKERDSIGRTSAACTA